MGLLCPRKAVSQPKKTFSRPKKLLLRIKKSSRPFVRGRKARFVSLALLDRFVASRLSDFGGRDED
jgi:hypothetical protein